MSSYSPFSSNPSGYQNSNAFGSISNLNPYANGNYGNNALFGATGNSDFTQSNSLVGNFAFLLLVIFVFVILLRIGISSLVYFMKPADSPHLFDGMVEGTQQKVFPQDPSSNGAVTIYRSVNADDGIEFSWSSWIFISNVSYETNQYRHVFSKGNSELNNNGMVFPNNAPGVYLAPNSNTLIVVMNTYDVINEEVIIPNIPINKWVNLIIRCQNTTLDVYINGTISRSINLVGVPKQNYGNVYVGMNGGFNGYLSNLWYYNYALGTSAIQKLVDQGPNTTMIGGNGLSDTMYNYLSMRWYFFGAGNGFNPDLSGTIADSSH